MNDNSEPPCGSVWKHRNGSLYAVLFLTNQNDRPDTYPRTVVYQGADGRRWSRPLADWSRSMSAGDRDDCATFCADAAARDAQAFQAVATGTWRGDDVVRPPERKFTGVDMEEELDRLL